jgi:hypothetical protein
MAAAKPYKIVLAGSFASGRTTFASQLVQAKRDMKKIRMCSAPSNFLSSPFLPLHLTLDPISPPPPPPLTPPH